MRPIYHQHRNPNLKGPRWLIFDTPPKPKPLPNGPPAPPAPLPKNSKFLQSPILLYTAAANSVRATFAPCLTLPHIALKKFSKPSRTWLILEIVAQIGSLTNLAMLLLVAAAHVVVRGGAFFATVSFGEVCVHGEWDTY
ncbi:hypothetical protein ScalyP_jg10869 [Parmales sp. scaly parma]|nr:hypothetical protein ScalyP_jg10869 [Parmales sp. scaly parma]